MKISSASKKVLASALSAAMVVAFAPTVALGADLGGTTGTADLGEAAVEVSYTESGVTKVEKFSAVSTSGDYNNGIQGAFDFAAVKGGTVKLLGDIAADAVVHGKVTVDLNGFTWSNPGNDASATPAVRGNGSAPITIAAAKAATTVGTSKLVKMTKADYATGAKLAAGTYFKAVSFNAAAAEDTYTYVTKDLADQVALPSGDKIAVKAGDMLKNYDAAAKTCTDRKTSGASDTIANNASVTLDGKYYVATVVGNSNNIKFDENVDYYKAVAGTEKTGALAAGDVTIKDSSEAKTGKVDGNSSDKDDQGNVTVYATEAVDIANGAKLAIKGGTFTTGSDTAVYANGTGTISAIDGTVSSVENAIIETVGGSVYVNSTTTDVKPQGVSAVVVSGKVKDSTITATAGDATENGGVAARALETSGDIENSTVSATAGKASKTKGATAVAIKASTAGTYKKVTATATANGLIENQAAKTNEYGATTVTAVEGSATINSGKYTGERKGSPTLQGGEFTKHIAASEIGTGFDTVCLGAGKSDFVFKTLSTGTAAASKTAFEAAVETAANNEVRDAIASAANYKVGVAFAEGYDAAKLAAAATDYDVAKDLSVKADIKSGAEAIKAAAGKTLTDEETAFNAAIDAVDAAAKAGNAVAFSYVNATAGISYADPAKASTRGYKGTPVLSITDLGLKYGDDSTSGDSHVSTPVKGLVDNSCGYESVLKNSLISGDAEKGLTTSTKTAATVNTFDGTAFSEVKASKVGTVTDFYTTKLGTLAVLSTNAGQVKDDVEKPAAEKATQGIEVDQKSKTVKLSKKATKTKKAQSFNLGATAQTGLSIAKASGSSKVTVSDSGKVTLKKGVKKGTYKATVTINAAATDAYYAAAKTVTVKFVVKK